MRCNKCGTESPDSERFCPVCGNKLQSGRPNNDDQPPDSDGPRGPLLDFQGWAKPERGLGPYIEASVYALLLAGGVAWVLFSGIVWPLYPLLAICGVVAWLRRL